MFKKLGYTLILLLLGVSYILNDYSFYLIIGLLPILLINFKKFEVDINIFLLVIFSISYLSISALNGNNIHFTSILYYGLYPLLFYLSGILIVKRCNNFYNLTSIIILIIVSYSFVFIINSIIDTFEYGFINYSRHIIISRADIFDKDLQGLRASLSIACVSMIFVPIDNKKYYTLKILCFLIGILGLISVIHFIHRTGVIIGFLCISLVIIKIRKKIKLINLITLIFTILLLFIFFLKSDLSNQIYDAYLTREIDTDSNFFNFGGRMIRWKWVFSNMLYHPFGNISSNSFNWAHNLWLDVYRISGIIPFLTIVFISYNGIRDFFKLVKTKEIPLFYSCLIVSLQTTFILQCSLEPIIESDIAFFWIYILLIGMTKSLNKKVHILK